MKSKMSFFNIGIIKQDFKQHGWLSIIYLLGLLFALPLQLLMIDPENYYRYENIKNVFLYHSEFQIIFLNTVPILAGIFLFRYLQVKESADMIHSLPIRRERLYINHIVSGLLMLLLPIIITAIVTWMIQYFVPFADKFVGAHLFAWIGTFSLMTIFLFIFTVLIGMVTGMSAAHGILTYIFLLFPAGIMALLSYHFKLFLYGFSESYMTEAKLEYLSPIIRFAEYAYKPFTVTELIIYIVLTLIFASIGYLLYKKRQLENATQAITFNILKPIFKFGVTFSTMLLGGAYFASTQNQSTSWLIFGYVIGGLFGYIAAEMVIQKTWRIYGKKLFLEITIYSLIIMGLFGGLQMDIIGYEKKLPEISQVEGVYYGNNYYELRDKMLKEKDQNNGKVILYQDNDYIEEVRLLHKNIIEKHPPITDSRVPGDNNRNMVIAYKLKNGDLLVREYRVSIDSIENALKPVMESAYYKHQTYRLDELTRDMKLATFYSSTPTNKSLAITDKDDILELKQIIKEEILNMSYEEMNDTRANWANIEFQFADFKEQEPNQYGKVYYSHSPMTNFEWKKSYKALEKWLADKGYLAKIQLSANDIKYMEIAKANNVPKVEVNRNYPIEVSRTYYPEEIFMKGMLDLPTVKIKDKTSIQEALENYSNYSSDGFYYVQFTTNKGEKFFGLFDTKYVPSFVEKLF